MKTKSNKRAKKTTNPPYIDLFGEVIVSLTDMYMWVCVVCRGRFLGRLQRYEDYLRTYDVAYKVQRAKITGFFDEITAEYWQNYHLREWIPPAVERFLILG